MKYKSSSYVNAGVGSPRVRQLFTISCLIAFFVLMWCWEPLHGSLGSPFWTILMIMLVVVYTGGSILMSRDGGRSGLEVSDQRFWIITGLKLALALIALILLVTIGVRASKIAQADLIENHPGLESYQAVSDSFNYPEISNSENSASDIEDLSIDNILDE